MELFIIVFMIISVLTVILNQEYKLHERNTLKHIEVIETFLSKSPGSKEAILGKINFDNYIDNLTKSELRYFNSIYKKYEK